MFPLVSLLYHVQRLVLVYVVHLAAASLFYVLVNFLNVYFLYHTKHKTLSASFVLSQTILPRDAMRKRSLCCRSASVRQSVYHVHVLYPDG